MAWILLEQVKEYEMLSEEQLDKISTEILKKRNWKHLKDDYWIDYTKQYDVPITKDAAIAIQHIRDKLNNMSWFKRLFFRI